MVPRVQLDASWLFAALMCLTVYTSAAQGDTDRWYISDVPQDEAIPGRHARTCHHGTYRCDVDPEARAGYPHRVAFWAVSMNACRYVGSYVGGGALPRWSDARCATEGTWGVDYAGCILPRRAWNSWNHGRRYQGGSGAYGTDGSHLLRAITHHP